MKFCTHICSLINYDFFSHKELQLGTAYSCIVRVSKSNSTLASKYPVADAPSLPLLSDSRGQLQAEKTRAVTRHLTCTHTASGHSAGVLCVFATDNLFFSGSQGWPTSRDSIGAVLGLYWDFNGTILRTCIVGRYWVHIDFQFRAILEDKIITSNRTN